MPTSVNDGLAIRLHVAFWKNLTHRIMLSAGRLLSAMPNLAL